MTKKSFSQPRSKHKDRTVEQLIRDAHKHLAQQHLDLSPSQVTSLVRHYKRQVEPTGFPFEYWLTAQATLKGVS